MKGFAVHVGFYTYCALSSKKKPLRIDAEIFVDQLMQEIIWLLNELMKYTPVERLPHVIFTNNACHPPSSKTHYFDHIGAKTIIVENDYIDRDFLEDYSGYYARCFHDYQRSCTRLHFFKP